MHPQTILAYEMNDKTLPVAHGAPIRLRVERQLGYKMAKYIMRIELVEGFAHIAKGRAATGRIRVTPGMRGSDAGVVAAAFPLRKLPMICGHPAG